MNDPRKPHPADIARAAIENVRATAEASHAALMRREFQQAYALETEAVFRAVEALEAIMRLDLETRLRAPSDVAIH